MIKFEKVKFSDELPKDNNTIFFFDKSGNKYAGHYAKGYVTHAKLSEFHPTSFYEYWLKETI